MKKDKRYLVIKKGDTQIKEWWCIEVTNTCFKIRNLNCTYHEGYSFLAQSTKVGEEFWILSTEISTTGEAKYKIIEELDLLTNEGEVINTIK